jgi:hypothetical protein
VFDPAARAAMRPPRVPHWTWMARDLAPPPPGSDADFGMPVGLAWLLRTVAREDLARARTLALAPLLARLRACGSAWARLRLMLAAAGILRRCCRDDHVPVPDRTVVCCHPRTGPPADGRSGSLDALARGGP